MRDSIFDTTDDIEYNCYQIILDYYYPKLSQNDLIKSHIWSFLDNMNEFRDRKIKVYYEIKKRNWDTSLKFISLSVEEFIRGFIYCVYHNENNNVLIPYLRNDIYYFKNADIVRDNYLNCVYRNFNGVRAIKEAILNYIVCDNNKYIHSDQTKRLQKDDMVFSINYYNNTCSLNNELKHIMNNFEGYQGA